MSKRNEGASLNCLRANDVVTSASNCRNGHELCRLDWRHDKFVSREEDQTHLSARCSYRRDATFEGSDAFLEDILQKGRQIYI